MKATNQFKEAIKKHLDFLAANDELFSATYAKPNKSLDECINYILNQVKKQGYAGYTDDEVYGMAVHYYDEDDIKDIKPIDCRVVVNHVVELTEEEKAEARKKAIEDYKLKCVREEEAAARKREADAKARALAKAKEARENQPQVASLFDF